MQAMTNDSQGVITCKAAVVWKAGEAFKIEEIKVDPPKSSEVRIKMLCASLCHTDILFRNGIPLPLFPRIVGHEGVGVIESVGEEVTDLKVGDRVIPLYLGECKECLNCKSGKTNLCHKHRIGIDGLMPDGTSRMTIGDQKIYHSFSCSTLSEYTVVDTNYVLKIDPELPLSHASFLACGFTTGFGAAWAQVNMEKGSSVVVLGLGAVGLGVIAGAKDRGASRIIGIDINELKHDKGEAFGMTDFINPKTSGKSLSELVKNATGGLGVDYCFECTGSPSLLNEAFEATKIGLGTVVLIGVGNEPHLNINYASVMPGRTLKVTIYGGVRVHSDLPKIIDKCVNNEFELDELLTHSVDSIDEINKVVEYMKEPDCVKVIINF